MERNEILERIAGICRDIFEDDGLEVTEETSASDINGWDSLVNMSIINEIEKRFAVEFSLEDMQNSKNIGKLVDVVSMHLEKKKAGGEHC